LNVITDVTGYILKP